LIWLSSVDGDRSLQEVIYGDFSGSMVKGEFAAKSCCRDNFFPDQANFDFYARVRELGYSTLLIKCKPIDHKLGSSQWVPVISDITGSTVPYESP